MPPNVRQRLPNEVWTNHLNTIRVYIVTYRIDFPARTCDLPAAWDHLRLVFARSMGPPGLPVTGPPAGSARLCGSSDPERSDRLSYREVSVVEVQEVLRAWLSGAGARPAAERAGVNVKTARRY